MRFLCKAFDMIYSNGVHRSNLTFNFANFCEYENKISIRDAYSTADIIDCLLVCFYLVLSVLLDLTVAFER